ncbi:unnamed protein product [Oppiella nova]|uniref:Uncharacterized protein n=1 Tax=Oppiella nova TaxID=334625 RepID=A0A7R9MW18_9ACAR|nr:unnamed protein product [Oppiella nova]CAG2184251.1 unnamed protein product [Oppiella nova]
MRDWYYWTIVSTGGKC